jgi:hypothetical protein
LLWVKGKPGSGKSTLLKKAFKHITETPKVGDRALVLSFFFHGRGVELQRTPLGFFRSLLHQILRQVPDALSNLVDTFERRLKEKGKQEEKWQWHPNELWDFFEASLPRIFVGISRLAVSERQGVRGLGTKGRIWVYISHQDPVPSPTSSPLLEKT